MNFKIGDVVYLKSGIFPITIKDINVEEYQTMATCIWLNYRDEMYEEIFDIDLLTNINEIMNVNEDTYIPLPPYNYHNTPIFIKSTREELYECKPGDIVKLKSNDTLFTVSGFISKDIECLWFNTYGYLKKGLFRVETLSKCSYIFDNFTAEEGL